jgi:hypothetical protein
MDNSITIPGYKYYVIPDSGERPNVFVTFLNLAYDPGSAVNGVAMPVSSNDLNTLDKRERNYERRDVTDRIRGHVDGTIWTYIGSTDARRRFERGLREGRAAVSREYYDAVVNDFATLGACALNEFWATTAEPVCQVLDLRRVDVAEPSDQP